MTTEREQRGSLRTCWNGAYRRPSSRSCSKPRRSLARRTLRQARVGSRSLRQFELAKDRAGLIGRPIVHNDHLDAFEQRRAGKKFEPLETWTDQNEEGGRSFHRKKPALSLARKSIKRNSPGIIFPRIERRSLELEIPKDSIRQTGQSEKWLGALEEKGSRNRPFLRNKPAISRKTELGPILPGFSHSSSLALKRR